MERDRKAAEPPPLPDGATPPPLPVAGEYYVVLRGETLGPCSLEEVCELRACGELTESSLFWTEGLSGWRSVDELPLLGAAAEGGSEPPPLPPAKEGTLPPLRGFSLGRFFADVFRRHSRSEMLELFGCGLPKTTPPLMAVNPSWPAPWLFSRMLVVCALLYAALWWAMGEFGNLKLWPAMVFVGSFAVPFCVLVLFFELNVRRDAPFYDGVKAMFAGGVMSLVFSLVFFHCADREAASFMGNSFAGPVEELAKLVAVVMIAGPLRNGRVLTGLFLGCAVGTGFAALESAGYVFEEFCSPLAEVIDVQRAVIEGEITPERAWELMRSLGLWSPEGVLTLRAALAPCGHVVWTAIAAGAFWMVQGLRVREGLRRADDCSIDLNVVADRRFLRIAAIPVLLHMAWNSEWLSATLLGLPLMLGIGLLGWCVALRLVQKGLRQIREEQERFVRRS